METELKKTFSWEIDNLSERNDLLISDIFSTTDGCEWHLKVYPKGHRCCDHLSLYLEVANPESLRTGWQRIASFRLVLLNQSGKELFDDRRRSIVFFYAASGLGKQKALPLTKLQEKGNNKLIVEVYIKVEKVVHQGEPIEKLLYNGLPILASQIASVDKIFREHPDFIVDFKPKNQGLTKAYINLILGLIDTLSKSPQSLSVTELSNAQNELTELTEAGFNLDWLKTKLEVLSLEKKKSVSPDGSPVILALEERVKNLEFTLSHLQVELYKEKTKSSAAAKVYSFEFIHFFIKRFFLSCFSISKH